MIDTYKNLNCENDYIYIYIYISQIKYVMTHEYFARQKLT